MCTHKDMSHMQEIVVLMCCDIREINSLHTG